MMAYDLYEVGETTIDLNDLDKNANWIHDVLKHAKYKKKESRQWDLPEPLERKCGEIYIKLAVLGEKLTRSQYCVI